MTSLKPIAWICKTCNKVDWADVKEQLAKPEHVSHRGVDIGTCKGKMIPVVPLWDAGLTSILKQSGYPWTEHYSWEAIFSFINEYRNNV
ncbi:hypothetical protein LCGC14_2001330 [marine sediment metagenome]|uniref:Uncharacterized protein n=1 Tax=marine sediment metagenome TaxID=412755 RepID=A0A0F9F3F2_9ZZZZ